MNFNEIKKHLSIHDGRLTRDFEKLYKEPHIAGYYRGLHEDTNTIKEIIKVVNSFIKKVC